MKVKLVLSMMVIFGSLQVAAYTQEQANEFLSFVDQVQQVHASSDSEKNKQELVGEVLKKIGSKDLGFSRKEALEISYDYGLISAETLDADPESEEFAKLLLNGQATGYASSGMGEAAAGLVLWYLFFQYVVF